MSNSPMSDILSELENAAGEYILSKQRRKEAAVVLGTCEEKVDKILACLREAVLKPDDSPTIGSGQ